MPPPVVALPSDPAARAAFYLARAKAGDAAAQYDVGVLYLRGDQEPGLKLARYVAGLKASGLTKVRGRLVPGSGHFAPIEQPERVASILADFVGL